MNNARLTEIISVASDAVASFLETILGEAHTVRVGAGEVYEAEAAAERLPHAIMLAFKADDVIVAGASISEEWLATLSQAMLGVALKVDEEGADDLIRELGAQVAGAIRSGVSGIDVRMPEVVVDVVSNAGKALEGIEGHVREVVVEVERPDAPLHGVLLLQAQPVADTQPTVVPELTQATTRAQQPVPKVNISAASFPELGDESISSGDGADFGLLSEVELEVTVELGRRRLPLADVLRLTTGSVIELEKLVGEPLEVYANGRLIAEGEAVVIDEQFGIRITNLVSSTKRTKAFI